MMWLWLKKTLPDQLWVGLDIHVHPCNAAMFVVFVRSMVSNGADTLFWDDKSLADLVPNLFSSTPKHIIKRWKVQDALANN